MPDFTQPTPMSVGEVFTSTRWNEQVADNAPIFWDIAALNVNGTVTETDLFNGTVTIPANAMGTNRRCSIWVKGYVQNTSTGSKNTPQFKLKLGGTALIDTSATGPTMTHHATNKGPFVLYAEIVQQDSASAQEASIGGWLYHDVATATNFTTGTGIYKVMSSSGVGAAIYGIGSGTVNMTSARLLELTVTHGSPDTDEITVLEAGKVVVGL